MQGCPSQDVPSPVPASTSAVEKKEKNLTYTVVYLLYARPDALPRKSFLLRPMPGPRTRIPREDEILRAFSVAVPPHPGPVLFLFPSRSFPSFSTSLGYPPSCGASLFSPPHPECLL